MNYNKKKYPILSTIETPIELRQLSQKNLLKLSCELRQFLLNSVSQSSGHLASGLGTIELTIALHYVYNTPFDLLIWDVGHQAYPHKILTGRRDSIFKIRKKNGLHPFPCRSESSYDPLSVGHSSTSISAGLGMAVAAKKNMSKQHTVCVIGDGAITAGMAFEAMNHAGGTEYDILVILNDNKMSISKNIGGLSNHLTQNSSEKYYAHLHTNNKNILSYLTPLINKTNTYKEKNNKNIISSNSLFEKLGFNYIGPINGHDIIILIRILKKIQNLKGPKILHVITKKGHGYHPAENDPTNWHAVPKFNPIIGVLPKQKNKTTYSEIFGNWLCYMASKDKKLIAITPAMSEGSGMTKFSKKYPNQYFDVGIAEQHAVTFAAGLAISGYKPIVAIYSTFLQRAYDQVIHDIAIQNLPVLFAVDRGGIVGADGQTHQGAFDLSYLRCIPNMLIMTPSNDYECKLMLYTGYNYRYGPSVVRYPRGEINNFTIYHDHHNKLYNLPLGKGVIYRPGQDVAILNFGTLLPEAEKAAHNLNATLVDMRFVKPLDEKLLHLLSKNHKAFITLEENSILGGAGSGVNEFLMRQKILIPVLNIGLPDSFIQQGSQKEIRSDLQLDSTGISTQIKTWLLK
ncbi:1-deoxy-D-xylulose-5-phosphate synthase [Blochmannia endosymbiont of Polyrhachis (Hedomyrma) turneri]|uniref:1-deoxy-D-xylulose-5-phosphate synthase n=1 Tax=Blochmannia endosymbiont of Polyrhachis (Hedomyrma) turneri TaxID=1505596 RepID=UPI00061A7D34|nr:1-deoxy-D-xylulose-5-phosphate synthase [Blochmannia endosymbiont of Polyrhachis (Hedomyrma) turneri]AKC59808.1 1-deoxy-D-xylulose-5-phosphate synthase [Blochmannia endosymbiont of Polyrhachis (Hedomyrma) turneri]